MAHFRGTIQGTQGEASRLGTKETGLKLKAQPWRAWNLEVELRNLEGAGTSCDVAHVELVHHATGERRNVGAFNLTTGERIGCKLDV